MSSAAAKMKEAALAQKQKFVRVGFEGAPNSLKLFPRDRMTILHINHVFNCDVEFLVEEETGMTIWPKVRTWPCGRTLFPSLCGTHDDVALLARLTPITRKHAYTTPTELGRRLPSAANNL